MNANHLIIASVIHSPPFDMNTYSKFVLFLLHLLNVNIKNSNPILHKSHHFSKLLLIILVPFDCMLKFCYRYGRLDCVFQVTALSPAEMFCIALLSAL